MFNFIKNLFKPKKHDISEYEKDIDTEEFHEENESDMKLLFNEKRAEIMMKNAKAGITGGRNTGGMGGLGGM